MAVVKHQIEDDAPSFFYYLLWHYTETSSHIVRLTQDKIDKKVEKMVKGIHRNVEKFTTYVSALLATFAENGGKDNLVFEKVYEVLTHSPCQLFNSRIVVYKQVNFTVFV